MSTGAAAGPILIDHQLLPAELHRLTTIPLPVSPPPRHVLSFAVVMFEILSHRVPFENLDASVIIKLVREARGASAQEEQSSHLGKPTHVCHERF